MTNEIQPTTEENKAPFGKRLRSKRESLGLERKEAASQLRLNERIIIMMENDKYPPDLPVTFIRGYLRSYGKLLQIPEFEVNQVLQLIQAGPEQLTVNPSLQPISQPMANHYFMQFFTYLVLLTLAALVGTWWYHHTPSNSNALIESRQITLANPANTDNHPNFGINTTETAAIPAASATIDTKALADNKTNAPDQQKLLTNPNQPPAIIAAAPSQKTVLDDTDNKEDDNDAE